MRLVEIILLICTDSEDKSMVALSESQLNRFCKSACNSKNVIVTLLIAALYSCAVDNFADVLDFQIFNIAVRLILHYLLLH